MRNFWTRFRAGDSELHGLEGELRDLRAEPPARFMQSLTASGGAAARRSMFRPRARLAFAGVLVCAGLAAVGSAGVSRVVGSSTSGVTHVVRALSGSASQAKREDAARPRYRAVKLVRAGGHVTYVSKPSRLPPGSKTSFPNVTAIATPAGPYSTLTAATYQYCPAGGKVNVRWHQTVNNSSGSWSGTASCTSGTGAVTIGPQGWGDIIWTASSTLQVGYDITLPGNNKTVTATVFNPTVSFTVACGKGTASPSSYAVNMPTQAYTVTGSEWEPSGDQNSNLVYQSGPIPLPNSCAGTGNQIKLTGTFTATVALS